jgi:hypothetical protein
MRDESQMMDNSGAVSMIRRMIMQYKQNPDAFDDEETAKIRQYAEAIGEPFSADFSLMRAGKNALWSGLDTASFGLLDALAPDSWEPKSLSGTDDAARVIGGLLGFAVPYSVGGKAAKWAMGGIKEAATAEKGAQFFQGLAGKGAGMAERMGVKVGAKSGGWFDDFSSQWKNVSGAAKEAETAAAAGADNMAKMTADDMVNAAYGRRNFSASNAVDGMSSQAYQGLDDALSNVGARGGIGEKVGNFFSSDGVNKAAQYGDAALTGLARVANRSGMRNIAEKSLQFGTASALDQGFEDPMNAPGRFIGGAITGGIGAGLGTIAAKAMTGQGAIGRAVRKLSMGLIKEGYPEALANKLAFAYYAAQLNGQGRFDQYEPLY